MSFTILLSPIAEEELYDSALWYNIRKAKLGNELVEEVDTTLQKILSNPQQFKTVYKNFRMALTKRFPFEIFYEIDDEIILVHHIFHASRNPKVWKKL